MCIGCHYIFKDIVQMGMECSLLITNYFGLYDKMTYLILSNVMCAFYLCFVLRFGDICYIYSNILYGSLKIPSKWEKVLCSFLVFIVGFRNSQILSYTVDVFMRFVPTPS